MSVLSRTLIYLGEHERALAWVRSNGLARRFARRFVAGETLDSAVAAARELGGRSVTASLNQLGESVGTVDEARAAAEAYLASLDRIRESEIETNISVKLTQLGLSIDFDLCLDQMRRLAAKGRELGVFVRIDMESSAYTERTLQLFERHLLPEFGHAVGVVIQSYLRRSADDLERLIRLGARVRLCKGAYREPAAVAFPVKRDVDRNYAALMRRLLEFGDYPGIATHDVRLIAEARSFTAERRIGADRFEFQMLYGVRRDLQDALRSAGYNLRVYIPFGTHWYPYLMRRLAERPANIAFIAGNLLKETLRR